MCDEISWEDRPYQWKNADGSWGLGRPAITMDGGSVVIVRSDVADDKSCVLMRHSYTPHLEWVEFSRLVTYPVAPIEQP